MLIVIIDTDPDGEAGRAAVDQALARVQPDTPPAPTDSIYAEAARAYEQAVAPYVSVPMTPAPPPGHMVPYAPDPTDNLISPATDPFAPYDAARMASQQVAAQQSPSPEEVAAWIEQQQRDAIARVAATRPGRLNALEADTPDIPDIPDAPTFPATPATVLSTTLPASSTVL